jgi:TPR repeat protein
LIHQKGKIVEQNADEAANWFMKAALQGHSGGQFQIGLCYLTGAGIQQNLEEGASWYLKAAEQGHLEAQRNLGHCYANDYGVPLDLVKAYMWLDISARGGLKDSAEGRDEVARQMTPEQIAEAKKLSQESKPSKDDN